VTPAALASTCWLKQPGPDAPAEAQRRPL